MVKKFLKNFRKKMAGAVAVEYIITAPIAFAMEALSIGFLIFILDYMLLSHVTSEICHNLNMGDTGYTNIQYVIDNDPTLKSDINTFPVNGKYEHGSLYTIDKTGHDHNFALTDAKFTKTKDNVFANAAKYYIYTTNQKYKWGKLPYCRVNNIEARLYRVEDGAYVSERRNFTTAKGQTESGDVVKVQAKFTFGSLIPFTVTSFEFID